MKPSFLVCFVTVLSRAVAQTGESSFEPFDFNVTEALIGHGIDVSVISKFQHAAERSISSACSVACNSLAAVFDDVKLLRVGSLDYKNFTSGYWSAQQVAVKPQCVFKPDKSLDVSIALLIARLTKCPFAIRGGGHGAFSGSSSIEGGVTISLESLKRIDTSPDKTTVSVGPGNRWVDVYQALEPQQLGVVGGRVFNVGVSGLILGGGISFFSNKYGWACDNVASYEVVTASGVIINATPGSYSDLYWALRGGGNNFGVVTNFKLNTFPLGKMWGGARLYANNSHAAVLDAIYKFATLTSSQDLDAAQIISFLYTPGFGPLAIAFLDYGKPVANASVFNDFNAITHVSSNTDIYTQSELTIMMGESGPDGPDGLRETYWDVTFKVDRDLFTFLVKTFYDLLPSIVDASGLVPVISIQAITEGQIAGMQKNGGNALGLDPSNGPYFIMNLATMWANPADDSRILRFNSEIISRVQVEARAKGLDNAFIYQNYASQFQDVFASYGEKNQKRLVKIGERYDPEKVFQDLQPGYFKLAKGAPSSAVP